MHGPLSIEIGVQDSGRWAAYEHTRPGAPSWAIGSAKELTGLLAAVNETGDWREPITREHITLAAQRAGH